MGNDPHSGIASVTMYDRSGSGQLSNGQQFSAVEVAPDAFLTAAHCVLNPDGSLRNYGDVRTASGAALAIDGVHCLDVSHTTGTEFDATVGTDLALIHVAVPDAGGTVFAMAVGAAGAATDSGYPRNAGGALVEAAQTVTAGAAGELLGRALLVGGDAEGSSGGPLWTLVDGVPTVEGINSAARGDGTLMAAGLTASDIAQITAWIDADDAGPRGAGADAVLAARASGAPAPAQAKAAVDPILTLAGLIGSAAPAAGGVRAAVMSDVASALAAAVSEGYGAGDVPDTAWEAAALLRATASAPRRAVAFMAGALCGASGVGRGQVADHVTDAFGLHVGGSMRAAEGNGYSFALSLGGTDTAAGAHSAPAFGAARWHG